MQTQNDENSVALSMQRLFYDMQTSKNSVSTKELINSFGWTSQVRDSQQDIQEFNNELADSLESKFKESEAETIYKNLFYGNFQSYVKCTNVTYSSIKEEKFFDIALTVKEHENLLQSFESYIKPEILDGDNLYDAGPEFGKQKAEKGIRFINLPAILQLQLKRFEYSISGYRSKINSKFEFQDEINLNFLTPGANNNQIYSLHTIIIHSGDANSGHYFTFIRPTMNDNWYRFNDEGVDKLEKKYIFSTQSYGGVYSIQEIKNGFEQTSQHTNNICSAYYLIYIRNEEREQILQEVAVQDIPDHLVQRFKKEDILRQQEEQQNEFSKNEI